MPVKTIGTLWQLVLFSLCVILFSIHSLNFARPNPLFAQEDEIYATI